MPVLLKSLEPLVAVLGSDGHTVVGPPCVTARSSSRSWSRPPTCRTGGVSTWRRAVVADPPPPLHAQRAQEAAVRGWAAEADDADACPLRGVLMRWVHPEAYLAAWHADAGFRYQLGRYR